MIYLMAIEDAEIVEQETENFVKLGRVFSVSMFNKNRIKSWRIMCLSFIEFQMSWNKVLL